MLQNLFMVATQVGTLFLMMAVGFVLAKLDKLPRAVLPTLSFLLMYIVTPCLIVDAMRVDHGDDALGTLAMGFGLALACYVLYAVLIHFCFRRQDKDTGDTLRFASIYGNKGFMGFPLIRAVLGSEAMLFAMPAFLTFQLMSWTHGAYVMGGREQLSLRRIVINPAILGSAVGLAVFLTRASIPSMVGDAVGLAVFLTRASIPSMVGDAVGYLADLNTPLAMVVIGAQMASADLPATFRNARLYASAAVKLAALPALTALVLFPFHLPRLLFCATVILAGTPTAGVTAMFAEQFDRSRETAAQTITLSTLLSILTLPVTAVAADFLTTLY